MSDSRGRSSERLETSEGYYIPRKFVFDVPEDKQKEESNHKTKALKKSLEAERHMPFVFNFPEPTNYKESYQLLVKQVISAYNHVRLLVVEEYYEQLKHVIKDFKIEQPSDCVNMLKEILSGCCERLQRVGKDVREEQPADPVKDYEEMLQKAEAKIRIFIRNEQIFRLNFDILAQKCDDADKGIQTMQKELDASKKAQESLTKENLSLTSKLRQKDDELKKTQKDLGALDKKFKDATHSLSTMDNNFELTGNTVDHNKSMTQSWNQQLLHKLLNENKGTPSETSAKMNPSNAAWNRPRQSSSKLPPTDKSKNEKKSGTPLNNSLLNTSSGNLKKGKSDKLKSTILADYKKKTSSNRSALNASLDVVLNRSTEQSLERTSITGTSLNSQKRSSSNIKMGYSQDQFKIKAPVKERRQTENSERETASYAANKSSTQNTGNTKYSNASTRPTSTGKSRGSPFVQRNRVAYTEQSPTEKSQESQILYTYTSGQYTDSYNAPQSGNSKKKALEARENRSQSKEATRSSMLIKSMIAEHLNKKLGGKKGY